jgi:regulator of replication initiation timing
MNIVEPRTSRKKKSNLTAKSAAVQSATQALAAEKTRADKLELMIQENAQLRLEIEKVKQVGAPS